MTNYERLKAMSLEEIARLLMGSDGEAELSALVCMGECHIVLGSEVYCPHIDIIEDDELGTKAHFPCHKCMEKWLRMEVSDENNA